MARATLDHSFALALPDGELPNEIEIQYMPPGRQTIKPSVEGQHIAMAVDITPKYATVFQTALKDLLAAAARGEGDGPYTDLNHDDNAASSRPMELFWGGEDDKKGGVRLRARLTPAGRAALAKA